MGTPDLDLTRTAQTNIALFRQMHRLGYPQVALTLVHEAYELATVLFTGRYRATGKPFVCHLIGTASVLASLRAAPEIVAAGVLHAAYETNPHTGMPAASRQRVLGVVGAVAEGLVFAYSQLKWNISSIRALAEARPSAESRDGQVVLMRLANEVDDHLDDGMAYCSTSRRQIDAAFDQWIEMAMHQGHAQLADTLRTLQTEQWNSSWVQPLSLGRTGSYAIASPRVGWGQSFLARLRRGSASPRSGL